MIREKIYLTELQYEVIYHLITLKQKVQISVFSLDIYHMPENAHWIETWMWEYQPINISMKFFILHSWVLDNSGAW